MSKEVITRKQVTSMMIMFIWGSAVVLGSGGKAKEDSWFAILLALIISQPVLFAYSKIMSIIPGKSLFDIITIVFGKFIGTLVIGSYTWYSLHLGALVIRNFSEFIVIVGIPETPQYTIILSIGLLSIWLVRGGIEVVARWSDFVFPIILIIVVSMILIAVPKMQLIYIKPFLASDANTIISSTFATFAFPFAEVILFTTLINNLKKIKSIFRIFFTSSLTAGLVIISGSLRNFMVLGANMVSYLYFPSYTTVSTLKVQEAFQRFEVLIALAFLFAGIVKISVCLYSASTGFVRMLKRDDYKPFSVPIGFFMMALSMILYRNTMEMFDWAFKVYKYYALPFEVIMPAAILITAKLRAKHIKKQLN